MGKLAISILRHLGRGEQSVASGTLDAVQYSVLDIFLHLLCMGTAVDKDLLHAGKG